MKARALLPLLLLLAVGGPTSCGELLTKVPLAGIGKTNEVAVSLPAGTPLEFPVTAASYSYSGAGYLLIDVELLRDRAVVARMTCRGFEFEGGAGAGCGVTHSNSDCALRVPAGGANGVRVGSRLENEGATATFEGLAVEVRGP